jgi:hypothetical protein
VRKAASSVQGQSFILLVFFFVVNIVIAKKYCLYKLNIIQEMMMMMGGIKPNEIEINKKLHIVNSKGK